MNAAFFKAWAVAAFAVLGFLDTLIHIVEWLT